MGLLNVKTTVMNSIVLCAQSPSSSAPVDSVSMVLCGATETRTARISQMRRTVKVSAIPRPGYRFPFSIKLEVLKYRICMSFMFPFLRLYLPAMWKIFFGISIMYLEKIFAWY